MIFRIYGGLCGALLLAAGLAVAQPVPDADELGLPRVRNVAPAEYGGGASNWGLAQDERGVLYVGNERGLLEYDGVAWRLHPPGGREGIVRSLALGEGRIWTGLDGDIGYFAADHLGRLRYTSVLDALPPEARSFRDVWATYVLPDGVYFQTDERLIRWAEGAVRVWEGPFDLAHVLRDTLYAVGPAGLLRLDGDNLRVLPESEPFYERDVFALLPLADGRALLATEFDGLYTWDGRAFAPFPTDADALFREAGIYDGVALPDGHLALATIYSGVVLLDQEGRVLRHLDRAAGLQSEVPNALFVDHGGALWIGLMRGLARVDASGALSFFGDDTGLSDVVLSVTRYDDAIYAGTSANLFRLQPASGLAGAHFAPALPPAEGRWDLRETFGLLAAAGDLLLASSTGLYRYTPQRPVRLVEGVVDRALMLRPSPRDPAQVYVGRNQGLARLTRHESGWTAAPVGGIEGSVWNAVEEDDGTLWVSFEGGGVARLRDGRVTRFGAEDGLPEAPVALYRVGGRLRIPTERGVLRYTGNPDSLFAPDPTFAPTGAASREAVLAETAAGDVWVVRGDGGGVLRRQPDGTYRWEPDPRLRRLEGFELYSIYLDEGPGGVRALWLAGPDGLARFVPSVPPEPAPAFAALLRRAVVGDTLLYDGAGPAASPRLAYGQGAVRFAFAAPAFDQPERTQYQVRLDGFDAEWSEWAERTEKEYTNLSEGRYTFRVRARDALGRESAEAAYAFTVLPPWYRTGWAYVLYVLGAVGVVLGAVKLGRWRLEEKNRRLEQIVAERTEEVRQKNAENERLLLNILPGTIAERLKRGEEPIADAFAEVTVLFADLVGFTELSQRLPAERLVDRLNELFSAFDHIMLARGIEKIKTIGDAYMAVAGLPEHRADHAEAMAEAALAMMAELETINARNGTAFALRVGLNTGPVVAGVIGQHKFIYDLWGDAVNTAARMESHGTAGRIHCTAATYERLRARYRFEARGEIEVKGKGRMRTYFLAGRRDATGDGAAGEVAAAPAHE